MRHIIPILIAIMAFSCTGGSLHDDAFSAADSLMESSPDSALCILERLADHSNPFGKKDRMRWLLLAAKAQNKCFKQMPDDSVFAEVVAYYDRHGTMNDRMLAHYLYGCISRDCNDAPKALERFYDAANLADTTNNALDYSILMAIYGQMADIYYLQNLPEDEIVALQKAGKYSLKAGNVRNYIKCIELLVRPYYAMDDTAAVLKTTSRAHDLYLKNGFPHDAAAVYPTAIFIYLKQGKYEKARSLMDDFEKNSGLFHNGEIVEDRRQYEYSRGMYYQGIHKTDSADYCYRKALSAGYEFEAYKGLLSLYSELGMVDSVKKYSPLYLNSVDDVTAALQTEGIVKMRSMYDYTQSRKEAEVQRRNADNLQSYLRLLLVSGAFIAFGCFLYYKSYKKDKEREIDKITDLYSKSMERLEEREEELLDLKKGVEAIGKAMKYVKKMIAGGSQKGAGSTSAGSFQTDEIRRFVMEMGEMAEIRDRQLAAVEDEIKRLGDLNKFYEASLNTAKGKKAFSNLSNSQIAILFRKLSSCGEAARKPNEYDWMGLYKAFGNHVPAFFADVSKSYGLTEAELRVTLLICIGISNAGLVLVSGKSLQRITNLKIAANKKIFGDSKASSLRGNVIQKLICSM